MIGYSMLEQVFVIAVVALIVGVTGGRLLMALIALGQENRQRQDVMALLDRAAVVMAAQRPEEEVEQLAYLLDALQRRTDRASHQALLHLLQARIADQLSSAAR